METSTGKSTDRSVGKRVLFIVIASIILAIAGLNSTQAKAKTEDPTGVIAPQILSQKVEQDQGRKFDVIEMVDANGVFEVRVYFREERMFSPDTKRLILIGRGIDVPVQTSPASEVVAKRVTSWFVPTGFGVEKPIEYFQIDRDPWPSARAIINQYVSTETDWFAWVALQRVARELSFAVAKSHDFYQSVRQQQLELYELEVRIEHRMAKDTPEVVKAAYQEILEGGYADLEKQIDDHKSKTMVLAAAGDIAFLVAGGLIGGVAVKGATYGAKKVLSQSTIDAIEATYSKLHKKVARRTTRTSISARNQAAHLTGRALILSLTARERTQVAIRFLQSRSLIGRLALKTAEHALGITKSAVQQIKYVGLVQGTQVIAEVAARPADFLDANPIVMAEKMLSDEDFVRNMSYMTSETFFVAGASAYTQGGWKKKIAVCATVSLINAFAFNYVLVDEVDPERAALDVVWQATIGNGQTQMDMRIMSYFESLNHPALAKGKVLAGYAVVLAEQGVGFWGYAKATSLLKEDGSVQENPVGDQYLNQYISDDLPDNRFAGMLPMENPTLMVRPVFMPL